MEKVKKLSVGTVFGKIYEFENVAIESNLLNAYFFGKCTCVGIKFFKTYLPNPL